MLPFRAIAGCISNGDVSGTTRAATWVTLVTIAAVYHESMRRGETSLKATEI